MKKTGKTLIIQDNSEKIEILDGNRFENRFENRFGNGFENRFENRFGNRFENRFDEITFWDENNFEENNFDENNFDENYFDENNFDENNFDENNFDENNFDENNFDENNLGENNFDENNLGENNFDENNFDENNLGENNLGENNLGENNFDRPIDLKLSGQLSLSGTIIVNVLETGNLKTNNIETPTITTDTIEPIGDTISIPNIKYYVDNSETTIIDSTAVKKAKIFAVSKNIIIKGDITCDGIEIILFNKNAAGCIIIRSLTYVICELPARTGMKFVYLAGINNWIKI